MSDSILKYKCPKCGHIMQVKRPAKSGVYNRVCPACQYKHQLKIKGTEEMNAAPSAPAAGAVPPAPQVPPPVPTTDEPYIPHTDPISLKKKGPAKITIIGSLFNSSFPLERGDVIVGRDDPSEKSDISIKGDPCVSRRSLCIKVSYNEITGYSFRMKVLKSTNPVLLNGSVIDFRYDEPFLNFGDTITIGKTKLRLDPLK